MAVKRHWRRHDKPEASTPVEFELNAEFFQWRMEILDTQENQECRASSVQSWTCLRTRSTCTKNNHTFFQSWNHNFALRCYVTELIHVLHLQFRILNNQKRATSIHFISFYERNIAPSDVAKWRNSRCLMLILFGHPISRPVFHIFNDHLFNLWTLLTESLKHKL